MALLKTNTGIGTTNPTSALHVIGDGLFTGVVTAITFSGQISSGVGTFTNLTATNATLTNINSSGITTLGVTTITRLTAQNIFTSGVTTSVGGFVGNLTGIAASATQLVTPRTFEITGDIVASPISFNGTGNVSLAATIQPNSVALGNDTTGDYVQTVTGTSNQITVTGGTGEGSTPTLSFPNQVIIPQDLTVLRDVQIDRNLNVNGNITIGGTSATIFSRELKIFDPDIILGFRTDAFGNDISNDNTANHGGVAVASTEGNPLVQLFIAGIETNPATYKKIMWFKAGEFAGLGTDAWLMNYAVGIGSTQFPTGTRLAAGSVQFTERDLAVVRNINASGIITAVQFIGTASTASFATTAYNLTDAANITAGTINAARLSGTYNINISGNAVTATYATSAGVATNVIGGIASVTQLSVSGISTLGIVTATQLYVSGVTTSVGGFVGNLTGTASTASFATTSSYLSDANNILSGTINVARLSGTYDIDINGNATTANYATNAGVSTNVIGGIASVTQFSVSGVSTLGTVQISSGIITATSGIVTYYGDGSNLQGIIAAAAIGVQDEGVTVGAAVTTLNFSGATVSVSNAVGGISTVTVVESGIANYALVAGIATYANVAGVATYATNAGVATNVIGGIASVTQLSVSGISTLGVVTAGNIFSTGIVTALSFVGNLTGTATTASFATTAFTLNGTSETNLSVGFARSAGIATNLRGGVAGNVPYQSDVDTTAFVSNGLSGQVLLFNGSIPVWGNVSAASGAFGGISVQDEGTPVGTANSISTLNFVSPNLSVTATSGANGIATITMSNNIVGSALSISGISTLGVTSATNLTAQQLSVSGVSTFAGITTVTGTTLFTRQLSVSGVSTIGNFRITPVGSGATVGGIGVTYFGDGSQLSNIVTGIAVTANTTNQNQLIPYATSFGSTTGFGVTASGLVFNPSTTRLGIGTTNPLQNLHIQGNLLVAAGSATTQHITQRAYELEGGSLSWEGTAGQLFSITNNLTSGPIFSVNDVSGIPSIEVTADGTIELAPFADGNVGIATTRPTSRLHVVGDGLVTGVVTATTFSGNATSATFATTAGVSTSVIGGIASVTQISVSGVSTFAGITTSTSTLFANQLSVAGVSTFAGITTVTGPTLFSRQLSVAGVASIFSDLIVNSGTFDVDAANNRVGVLTTFPLQPFQVNPTGSSVVVVDTLGRLGIGITNPTSKLHVIGDALITGVSTIANLRIIPVGSGATVGGIGVTYFGDGSQLSGISAGLSITDDTSTNATRYILFDDSISGTVTSINVSSTKLTFNPSTGNLVAGGTVTANSDEKLKENVKTIENALDKVLSLRGVEFDRIDTGDHQIGVIAQEVEKIIPDVVYPKQPSPDYETKSVAYANLVGLLIEAVKEQNRRIDELERRLEGN